MKISDLTGIEHGYWSRVANDYSTKYGRTIDDFRVYDKTNCITFNSSNRNTYVLSNFYHCNLTYDGTHFHSSEQLYFYLCTSAKPDIQKLVMQQPNALAVKKLHLTIDDKNPDWVQTRNQIMRTALRTKYEQCKEYRDFLTSTGEKDLLEYAYWWDLYWGTSTTKNSSYYVGINALGRLHMELRNKHNNHS